MGKALEKGQDKVQKLCDVLRKETLEPAQEEAEKILVEARKHAEKILQEAHTSAKEIVVEGKAKIEQERQVFVGSLIQASKQAVEGLRQEIEAKLFNEQLHQMLIKQTTDPSILAKMIDAIIKGIEKDGTKANLTALIPEAIPTQAVNQLIMQATLEKLKEKSVSLGSFQGGVQVRLTDKGLTLDLTDIALQELLARYVRKDFRKFFFGLKEE